MKNSNPDNIETTLDQLKDIPADASLRDDEKRSLSQEFSAFMDANPISSPASLPSPFWATLSFGHPVYLRMAVLLFIVTGTFGGLFSIEQSDPDDLLYEVKTTLGEPVLLGLSSYSPELRAHVNKTLMTRRLEESESLILRKEFTSIESEKLHTEIKEHLASLQEYIKTAEAEGSLDEALAISNDIEALTDAHQVILNNLSSEEVEDAEIELLISTLEEAEATATTLTEVLEEKLDTSDTNSLVELQSSAEETYAHLQEKIENHPADTDARFLEEARLLSEESRISQKTATEKLLQGDTATAKKEFRESLQKAETATLILESHENLLEIIEEEEEQQ